MKFLLSASSDKKTNDEFFCGLISNVEIYDIALTDEEIIEISQNPNKLKVRNFGEFKSKDFLLTQINPLLSDDKKCNDISGEYGVSLENIYLYKDTQSFKTFLPKPYRRESRFQSLKHKTNSSIGNKWVHQETRRNQIKYYNEVKQDLVDFRIDGLNTLRFNEVSKEENNLVTKISIEL